MVKYARPSTFGALLRAELASRCAQNPSYSLRAFAKFLSIDHASLSQLIRSRRELTPETIERLGEKLGLSADEIASFVADARAGRASSIPSSQSVASDAAAIVDDPVHHSILSLMTTEDFRPDSRFIARVLDISLDSVNLAVQRLARFGLLHMSSETDWRDVAGSGFLEPEEFERSVWEQASRRLAEQRVPPPSTISSATQKSPTAPDPVRQFQILAGDPAAAATFYAELFGWSIDDANALGYRQIATGPAGLPGGIWPTPPEAPAFVQLLIQVPDVAATVSRARELGAKLVQSPQALLYGDLLAVLLDPAGISFGVFRCAAGTG